jgi:cobalamin biosynthesis protein CobD/CbiB
MWPAPTFLSVALALAVERLAGYPEALQRTAGHPVAWMGWLIGSLDRALNAPGASAAEGRLRGGTALAVLLAATFLPASRLSGALFAAAASTLSPARGRPAWRAMWRDAPGHVSPNAGWPEAAFAAGLGLRLGGPRAYDGITVDLAWMGEGRSQPGRDDIRAGLRLYGRALNLLLGLMLAAAVFS